MVNIDSHVDEAIIRRTIETLLNVGATCFRRVDSVKPTATLTFRDARRARSQIHGRHR